MPAGTEAVTERNRAVILDFIDVFMTHGRVREAFEKHADPGYVQHSPDYRDGREATVEDLETFFAAMEPGYPRIEVQRVIVDGDFAVVHLRGRGADDDRGVVGTDVFRMENGKIVEHWDVVQPIPAQSRNSNSMY